MSAAPPAAADEARAARIQRYKDERRKQLAARTAAILCVTPAERRNVTTRKASERPSTTTKTPLKSSSELNLSGGVAVAVRPTKTSKLRAAALAVDCSLGPAKARNASTQSLDEIKPTPRKPSATARPGADRHARRRSLHVDPPKSSISKQTNSSSTCNKVSADESFDLLDIYDADDSVSFDRVGRFTELLNMSGSSLNNDAEFDDVLLANGIDVSSGSFTARTTNGGSRSVHCSSKEEESDRRLPKDELSGRRPSGDQAARRKSAKDEASSVRSSKDDGAVRRTLREETAVSSSLVPARRGSSTRSGAIDIKNENADIKPSGTQGNTPKNRARRSNTTSLCKAEPPGPHRTSSKGQATRSDSTSALHEARVLSTINAASRTNQHNRTADTSTRSFITSTRKTTERDSRERSATQKPDFSRKAIETKILSDPRPKRDLASIPLTPINKRLPASIKSRTDSGPIVKSDKAKVVQKDTVTNCGSTALRYSNKRLTNLDDTTEKKSKFVSKNSQLNLDQSEVDKKNKKNIVELNKSPTKMSTVEDLIPAVDFKPYVNSSRISQRMDNLAALTKQTLDRVNKLSCKQQDKSNEIIGEMDETSLNGRRTSSGLEEHAPINRGVSERLREIDAAAQHLIDFEKQSVIQNNFDLRVSSSSQKRHHYPVSTHLVHQQAPVSILKRKSIQEELTHSNSPCGVLPTPPVTFSPNVIDPRSSRLSRQTQSILKKRRSLDESQVSRRRSCSPEVSFAEDGTPDFSRPILKNQRRSSLEDVIRNQSPDNIQGILKRKLSREEEHLFEDGSLGSPEPQGILKRKSNSSSSSSTTSSHVSIAQAVILAAAGGAEIINEDKEIVRPILKKKSFSEERPCPEIVNAEAPKPILKKKSLTDSDDYEHDRPKKPILKTCRKVGEEGNTSSFDLSEDDRGSRRSSLLKNKMPDISSSECDSVKPILKQRASSRSREQSQSPRPRLSFCAGDETNKSLLFNDSNDLDNTNDRVANSEHGAQVRADPAARCSRMDTMYLRSTPSALQPAADSFEAVRRRNSRPKVANRSKSLACDFDHELFSVLRDRRSKAEDNYNLNGAPFESKTYLVETTSKSFPSVASRIKCMEQYLSKDTTGGGEGLSSSVGNEKRTRYKGRHKTQPVTMDEIQSLTSGLDARQTSGGAVLDALQHEVEDVLRALDRDAAALNAADGWSLDLSLDSGVFNRPESRDSGPHSVEELIGECASSTLLADASCEMRAESGAAPGGAEEAEAEDERVSHENCRFLPGLAKSNSVSARACMWQQLQQQAKGVPRPLIRHSRNKSVENALLVERFKTQPITFGEVSRASSQDDSHNQSRSSVNLSLERDEDAKLDEDDPAKMSLSEKMKLFNAKLSHKPPVAAPRQDDRARRATRLRTVPILASQVNEAMEQQERVSRSLTISDEVRDCDFKKKMELFRSASLRNAPLEYVAEQNLKNKNFLDNNDCKSKRAERMITPEVRGILKTGGGLVGQNAAKNSILIKGESSEGLKDEGIDSSSSSSESDGSRSTSSASCSSSEDEAPHIPRQPVHSKLHERINTGSEKENEGVEENRRGRGARVRDVKKRFMKKAPEVLPVADCPGLVRKYVPQVSKSASVHAFNARLVAELKTRQRPRAGSGSGSDGESSGGREVRLITSRRKHHPSRAAGIGGADAAGAPAAAEHAAAPWPLKRSATQPDGAMPHRGSTIAERLAALQQSGANDWRKRVSRLSPEDDGGVTIEKAKNRINESLSQQAEEKRRAHIEEPELGSNILADRRSKLETAAQGWKKRVGQHDAALFSVAGRLERDRGRGPAELAPDVPAPPVAPASPGVPLPNNFRSRRPMAVGGPLRSASCAAVGERTPERAAKLPERTTEKAAFKRSQSANDGLPAENHTNEEKESGVAAARVAVPRADDETFTAFFTPAARTLAPTPLNNNTLHAPAAPLDLDLDAIDSAERHLLVHSAADRVRRGGRQRGAARNPLRALAARTDLLAEYTEPVPRLRALDEARRLNLEKISANSGLAVEALAALASHEDFLAVPLKSSALPLNQSLVPYRSLMLLHVKGRRRVQTRLVEPIHSNVNRGDCFVLVTPDQVFYYAGLYSNVIERSRGADIALHIHNTKDLGCKNSTSIITIDEQTRNYTNKQWAQFWSLLDVPGHPAEYKPVEAGHPDEDEIYESNIIHTNMCYELIGEELEPIKEYWGQTPKIAMLNPSKIIVFDFGSEMYIWNGKNASLESRKLAVELAKELFNEGYDYKDCHICPLHAATVSGARETPIESTKVADTRPEWTLLAKVTQHMETILFREKFLDWPDFARVIKVKTDENSRSNSVEISPCDSEEMWSNEYEDPDMVLEGSHVGRGTAYHDKETMRHFEIKTKSVSKWIIQEYDYQKIEDEKEIADFYSADSYIIRWEYRITATGRELNGKPSKFNLTGRDRCAYFCWQGRDASSNEKGTAALLTVELDREKGPQVRVTQGHEPPAFLNLFQGDLVIHQGKRGSDTSRYKLFMARGNLANESYLTQVPCSMRQLRSRGSMLLLDLHKDHLYIWHGVRSMKHTKNIALDAANKLISRHSRDLFGAKDVDIKITEVNEGSEPPAVLEALGGANRQLYYSLLNKDLKSPPAAASTPRLFHFTDLAGQFEANEVLSPLRHEQLATPYPFTQKELYSASQPALFMLDDGRTVWLWEGWWPNNEEMEPESANRNAGVGAFAQHHRSMRRAALETALAYWSVSRGDGPPRVYLVMAGLEPLCFTNLFDDWNDRDDEAEINMSYGFKPGERYDARAELSRLSSTADGSLVLPLAELQQRPLPPAVDPHRLEAHLSPSQFQEAFGMTKDEFAELPAWKQTNMKKDLGLF